MPDDNDGSLALSSSRFTLPLPLPPCLATEEVRAGGRGGGGGKKKRNWGKEEDESIYVRTCIAQAEDTKIHLLLAKMLRAKKQQTAENYLCRWMSSLLYGVYHWV